MTALGRIALVLCAGCGRLGFDAFGSSPPADSDAPGDAAASGLVPIHQYSLDNSFVDDFGGPPLTGRGTTFTAGGYQFVANQGLSGAGIIPAKLYTVDIEFSFDTLASWRKILDFKDLTTDEGLYTFDSSLQFVVVAGQTFATSPPVFALNTRTRVTLTRDANGTVVGYFNGTQYIAFVDNADVGAFGPGALIAHFFIDDPVTSGEASGGTVRRIRIYDVALDPLQVKRLD